VVSNVLPRWKRRRGSRLGSNASRCGTGNRRRHSRGCVQSRSRQRRCQTYLHTTLTVMFRLLLRIALLAVMVFAFAIPDTEARPVATSNTDLTSNAGPNRALLTQRSPNKRARSLIEVATSGLFDIFGFEVSGRCTSCGGLPARTASSVVTCFVVASNQPPSSKRNRKKKLTSFFFFFFRFVFVFRPD
jgi:hypothetical protein